MGIFRRFSGIAVIITLSFCLAACGAKSSGEMVDSGKFKAQCPDGFLNIPQTNLYVQPDEDGNYPPDPTLLMFSYGASNETEAVERPSVTINILENTDMEKSISGLKAFYNKLEEKTFTVGDKEYPGVYGEMEGFVEGDKYIFEVFYVEKDDALFQIAITNNTSKESDLNVEHKAIATIVESIALD